MISTMIASASPRKRLPPMVRMPPVWGRRKVQFGHNPFAVSGRHAAPGRDFIERCGSKPRQSFVCWSIWQTLVQGRFHESDIEIRIWLEKGQSLSQAMYGPLRIARHGLPVARLIGAVTTATGRVTTTLAVLEIKDPRSLPAAPNWLCRPAAPCITPGCDRIFWTCGLNSASWVNFAW